MQKFRLSSRAFFFFFWGPAERKATKDQLPLGTRRPTQKWTKTASPFMDLKGSHWFVCVIYSSHPLHGSKYVFYTPCDFSVDHVTLRHLQMKTKSHFSDLMGQDMKQKEVKTEWKRLGEIALCERQYSGIRHTQGRGVREGWVRSPGSPRKGWDCVARLLCAGPPMYVG